MNAIDYLNPAHTCAMVGRLVRDDKDINDLIADQLLEFIKVMRTPGLTANDLAMRMVVRATIGEELLIRRNLIKKTTEQVPA